MRKETARPATNHLSSASSAGAVFRGILLLPLLCVLVLRAPAATEPLGPCSRRTALVISEILYHPTNRTDGKHLEFVELYNSKPFPEDISGYQLAIGLETIGLPTPTIIPGKSFLVVARKPNNLMNVYGLTNLAGSVVLTNVTLPDGLPNGSATVTLLHRSGAVLLQFTYSDELPWPVAADGTGHSLVLARPSYGEADPAAWAASDRVGGSPGAHEPVSDDPLRNVRINEFRAHSVPPRQDFIELYNHSNVALDLSGCSLSDDAELGRFIMPTGTVIAARGYLVFSEREMAFSLRGTSGRLFLANPDHSRVLDAVSYQGQWPDRSMGRSPDGAPEYYPLAETTRGLPNSPPADPDLVISEISYHPISGDPAAEFIELYNRGTNKIELTGLHLSGAKYAAPCCDVIYPGDYVVLRGGIDFTNKLSDFGERIALTVPVTVIETNVEIGRMETNEASAQVSEFTYQPGGRWGRWSSGGGASLELIDLRANPRWAPNWSDSVIGEGAWAEISESRTLDTLVAPCDALEVILLGEGEALIDDVAVTAGGGGNLVANPDFDSGLEGWSLLGNHNRSSWETNTSTGKGGCLHLRASGRGDTRANHVRTALKTPVAVGTTATISARVRWVRGEPQVLLRLKGSYLEAKADLAFTEGGTPGQKNSRALTNAGPAIHSVTHAPILPAAGEPVTITARVDDPDGVASVRLRYRVDPASSLSGVWMNDDGVEGDAVGGDGVYSGTIPGQPAGTLVAFHLKAIDRFSPAATNSFPADAPERECLVRFGEPNQTNAFGTYRLWMTQAVHQRWSSREKLSNEPLDVTFVYGGRRVIYNVGATYNGSPATSEKYDAPTGTLCGYELFFPADERFLGATHLVLDFPTRDATAQRQQLMYWFLEQLGLPFNYRRYVNLFVNGVGQRDRRGFGVAGTIYEDTQEPDLDLVLEWFPLSKGGHLYKGDDLIELSEAGRAESTVPPTLGMFSGSDGKLDTPRYRWNWRHRDAGGKGSSYGTLFELVRALNSGQSCAVDWQEAVIDRENWMRTFAMNDLAANWDSFGNSGGKNTFLFKPDVNPIAEPAAGEWKLLSWDFDAGLGLRGSRPDAPLFEQTDPVVARFLDQPAWQRAYWRALDEAVRSFSRTSVLASVSDARYAALAAVGAEPPDAILDFVSQRRTFLRQALASVQAPFAITTEGGQDFATRQNRATLNGTAPVAVMTIQVNHEPYAVTWTSVTNWQIDLVLAQGVNQFVVQGVDRYEQQVTGASNLLQITFWGSPEPAAGNLVINEVLNHPVLPGTEFIEIHNRATNTAFDLSRFPLESTFEDPAVAQRLTAPACSFAPGTVIAPGEFVVLAKDREAFFAHAGGCARVAGDLKGNLFDPENDVPLGLALSLGSATTVFLVPRFPMPIPASGVPLQLIDPEEPNWHPGNWAADPGFAPSPGTTNTMWMDLPHFPPLVLLQVLPQNVTNITDSAGQPDPWVKLLHYGTNTLPLDGFRLALHDLSAADLQFDIAWLQSQGLAFAPLPAPAVWEFPPGSAMPRLRIRVVWLDGEPEQTTGEEWHTSFRAAPDQARLVLTRVWNGREIYLDHFDYGVMKSAQPDVKYYRSVGSVVPGNFGTVGTEAEPPTAPTGGSTNWIEDDDGGLWFVIVGAAEPGDTSVQRPAFPWPVWPIEVRFNEWMADNSCLKNPVGGQTDDWFELFNLSTNQPAYLEGCTLTDNPAGTNRFTIPAGVVIPPRGFLLVWADDAKTNFVVGGQLHVPFKLEKSGEALALFDPYGALIDSVTFGRQGEDVSQGRWRDGMDTLIFMTNASPGARNFPDDWPTCAAPPPVRIAHDPQTGVTLWFPAPDCPGEFVGQCNDVLGETDWVDLPPVEIEWSVDLGQYLWASRDPATEGSRHRFYRVRLGP
jgi:hypothetical protein